MMPFDAYRCYLSLKNHFTKDHYDYHRYGGKTRATKEAFYKRKDRFWFERFSRQKNDKEVVDFFVSNFVSCSDPESMWIGEMIKEGEGRYVDWKKKVQSFLIPSLSCAAFEVVVNSNLNFSSGFAYLKQPLAAKAPSWKPESINFNLPG